MLHAVPRPEPLRMFLKGEHRTTGGEESEEKDFQRRKTGPQTEYNQKQVTPASQFSLGPAQAIVLICKLSYILWPLQCLIHTWI